MCGRYVLFSPASELSTSFKVDARFNVPPRYNIAPSQAVLAVVRPEHGGGRQLAALHWGLVPEWMKEFPAGQPMFNARVETLLQKPSFRNATRYRRCLVPANGFYEWVNVGGQKQPHYIFPNNAGLTAFAGLWEEWTGPGGDSAFLSLTVVTKPATGLLKSLHDRMPVTLQSEDHALWLGEAGESAVRVLQGITPMHGDDFSSYPVSRHVGDVRVDEESLIKAIEPPHQKNLL